MGLAELLERSARLRPTKERFDVLVVGEAERGCAVTLGVFISSKRDMRMSDRVAVPGRGRMDLL